MRFEFNIVGRVSFSGAGDEHLPHIGLGERDSYRDIREIICAKRNREVISIQK